LGLWFEGKDYHILGMILVPQGHDLIGGFADVGAVVHLAGEGAGVYTQPGKAREVS